MDGLPVIYKGAPLPYGAYNASPEQNLAMIGSAIVFALLDLGDQLAACVPNQELVANLRTQLAEKDGLLKVGAYAAAEEAMRVANQP